MKSNDCIPATKLGDEGLREEEEEDRVIGLDDIFSPFAGAGGLAQEEFFCLDCEGCESLHCEHNLHPRKLVLDGHGIAKHFRYFENTCGVKIEDFI